jgi:hypothetical protein
MGSTTGRQFYEFIVSHKRVWRLATQAEANEYHRTGRVPSLDPPRQATSTRSDEERYYGTDMGEADDW